MQVLGDLIRLPANEEKGLPLPWWHRAPLGLSNNTNVFVGLTLASKGRPVPDLIVTVLKPSRWNRMFRLDCQKRDEPGIVAAVFDVVPPLNIALAETVKLENLDLHHVSLICEPAYEAQNASKEIERITRLLKKRGFRVKSSPLPKLPQLAWHQAGSVKHGWVTGVKWSEEISKKYAASVELADLMKVVVSADTESRVLRFVFPRRGAMTASIKHADEPGALARITAAIKDCPLNILSAFLRRGGGGGVDAELVAVCEPITKVNAAEANQLKTRLDEMITRIPQSFRTRLRISDGKYAEEAIYSQHPEEIVARVPQHLWWSVQNEKEKLRTKVSGSKIPVFLSHRFSDSTRGSRTLEDLRDALKTNDCQPVEAEAVVGRDPVNISIDVSAKLWASQAGIFLVTKELDKRHISINLAHELGFLSGQGKAVLMLVEDEKECIDIMNSFANVAGMLFERFVSNIAKDEPRSIHSLVGTWAANVKKALNNS